MKLGTRNMLSASWDVLSPSPPTRTSHGLNPSCPQGLVQTLVLPHEASLPGLLPQLFLMAFPS